MRHGTTLGPLKNIFLLGNFLLKNRFCHFFLNYRGLLEGRVRDNKYIRLPIPKGGLEIPIVLIVNVSSDQTEAKERLAADDLDEYGPEEENTLEMEEQNHPSEIGEDNIIVIEDKWILF